MKKRLGSIDLFRGLCITWMIIGHTIAWWTTSGFFNEKYFINLFADAMGASGFLFISGLSLTLSYRKKREKAQNSHEYNFRHLRLEYFLRALFILTIGFIYNFSMAIQFWDIFTIWQWFILQTLPVSMMLIWPLLKCKIYIKILIAALFLIIDAILFPLLSPFAYEFSNPLGIIHYFLYYGYLLSPILGFFPFFISGSIIGDILYDNYFRFKKQIEIKRGKMLLKFSLPTILIGIGLILIGYFIGDGILIKNELPWLLYAAGTQLIIFSTLFTIEKLVPITFNNRYRFFYYFSYYSFSIFLLHYLIYFLFLGSLTLPQFFLIIPFVVILIGLGLKGIHHKLGPLFSLKAQISRLATKTAFLIEGKLNDKQEAKKPAKTIKI